MKKIKLLATIVGLVAVFLLVFAYGWLRSSLPQTTGSMVVDGVTGPVTIARDDRGVPHISADNFQDLNFGIGFVHAQDRLWQLEVNRRIGRGEISELFGDATLSIDKLFRTLNFRDKAAAAYKLLSPEAQAVIQSYTLGVNAAQKVHNGALPPEFIALSVTPRPWTAEDTMVWLKMMAFDLSGNYRHELMRAQLMQRLPASKVNQYYPTYPGDPDEAPFPDFQKVLQSIKLDELAALLPAEKPEGYGSNNWVLHGSITQTGKPLLANDPHLRLSTPSIWYLVRLHNRTTGKNTVGVTLPAAPTVVLGRNDKLAWGFTNTYPDTQDLFIEKVEDGGKSYRTPTGIAAFETRTEVINIKDKDSLTITVRESRHGPILSDIITDKDSWLDDDFVLALRWTALDDDDTTARAGMQMSQAETIEDFIVAAGAYATPQQNMILAETSGDIGYYAPGKVPVRAENNGINGRIPSPGWDATYDWQGYLDYQQLPRRHNPESNMVVTANEKIVDAAYGPYITRDWALPYRGNRIRHQLKEHNDHTVETMASLHSDIVSDMARDLKIMLPKQHETAAELLAALKSWDGEMAKDRFEPLAFDRWLRAYTRLVLADELGDMFERQNRAKPYLLKNIWMAENGPVDSDSTAPYYALPTRNNPAYKDWCDNVTTNDTIERCSALSVKAFDQMVAELTGEFGADWRQWQWGASHILIQPHRPFSNVDMLKGFFELSAPQGGGRFTVNVAGNSWAPSRLNGSGFGSSYRGIFDLADMDNSRYVIPTGQSGNPFSDHYSDQFDMWQKVQSFTIPTREIVPTGSNVLTLQPNDANITNSDR